jgi:outer membrane protein OmpA-like peptidoglycan-associated protein
VKQSVFFIGLMLALTACQTPAAFTPRQVAALRDNGFHQNNDDWMLNLDDRLLFPLNGSTVSPTEGVVIGHISVSLNSVGIFGAEIDGYTDSTGSQPYNDELSKLRAEAVKAAMTVPGGMQPNSIQPVGLGDRDPVADNNTTDGRMQNRRAVIIVSPPDAQPQPST